MTKKQSGSCLNCGRKNPKLVSYCARCIERETKRYEKSGWTRVKKG